MLFGKNKNNDPRGVDEQRALELAVTIGSNSPCQKSKRGVVIFHRTLDFYAYGCNHPPEPFKCDGSEACRVACNRLCVHAEMAALNYLRHERSTLPDDLEMLHVKVVDGKPVPSGPPSCWQCSREILDFKIKTMWLLHEEGLKGYTAKDFHVATLRYCGLPIIC